MDNHSFDSETVVKRFKSVLTEKFVHSNHNKLFLDTIPYFARKEFLSKSRFLVEMNINDESLNTQCIQGFLLSTPNRTLKIRTTVMMDQWIDDYLKVNIIKLFLLDNLGNETKNFDFDVNCQGYNLDCDYSKEVALIPCLIYKIIGQL